MSANPENTSQARRAVSTLLDLMRASVGMEQAFEVLADIIYLSWAINESDDGRILWERVVPSGEPQEVAHLLSVGADRFDETNRAMVSGWMFPDLRILASVVQAIAYFRAKSDEPQVLLVSMLEALVEHQASVGSAMFVERGTPRWLAQLMADTLASTGAALDPMCGLGTSLRAMAANGASSLSGYEINSTSAQIAQMRLRMVGAEAEVTIGDTTRVAPMHFGRFDSVTFHPPWGLRLNDEQRNSLSQIGISRPLLEKRARDLSWIALAVKFLNPDGRAAVLLPQAGPLSGEVFNAVRENMDVEALISFPSGIIGSAALNGTLWIVRPRRSGQPPNVLMVDTATFGTATSRREIEYSAEALSQIKGYLAEHKSSGLVHAPAHVACSVPPDVLDPRGGFNPLAYLERAPVEKEAVPEPSSHLLASLRIVGYKAFDSPSTATLAPITLLYGANSAGKSSLIQSLLLLKQSLGSSALVTQGDLVDVGSFTGIRHNHQPGSIAFGVTFGAPVWDLPESGTPDPSLQREVAFEFSQSRVGRARLDRSILRAGDCVMPWTTLEDGTFRTPIENLRVPFELIAGGTFLYPYDSRQVIEEDPKEAARRARQRTRHGQSVHNSLVEAGAQHVDVTPLGILPSDRATHEELPFPSTRRASVADSYINRFARLSAGLGGELRSILGDLCYLGPLRSAPQRFYERIRKTGRPGDGRDIAMYLFDNKTAIRQVNQWFASLEVPYELGVESVSIGSNSSIIGDLVALTLTDRRSGVVVTPADVGFGISQLLPIVVELLARRETVVCIEQPETHLHPRLQARLADLFLESADTSGRGNQLIVETHSEHLLLRLQRRIREGAVDVNDVSVLYVDQNDQGVASIEQLRMDEDGDFIDEWPGGFFDDRLDEMFGGLE